MSEDTKNLLLGLLGFLTCLACAGLVIAHDKGLL